MRIGSLCSGYGGLTLAVQQVLGGEVAWHSEVDPAASLVLDRRWPGVPNLGDMTAIDWAGVEPVDVLEGGTPCQDVSHAGRRAGMRAGTRSGLWASMVDAIDALRPKLVVWENVRGVLSAGADSDLGSCPVCVGDGSGPALRALGRVLGDLAELGYDARWCGLRASDVGAPHPRYRVFVIASDTKRGPGSKRHDADSIRGWTIDTEQTRLGSDPAQDTDQSTRGERRITAPGQTESGRARADTGGRDRAPVADSDDPRRIEQRGPVAVSAENYPAELDSSPVADTDSDGLAQFWREHPGKRHVDGRGSADTAWGPYEPAIRRWEAVTRPAPIPRESGRTGERLSPRFVEWMMGLPDGWVTDVPGISRNDRLKMLGNGVVPQQAVAAIRYLLEG